MTSPFQIPTGLGQNSDSSHPQPGGQAIGGGGGGGGGGSPFDVTALLPQIASSTSGLGLTPGSNPFLALQPGSTPTSNPNTNVQLNGNGNGNGNGSLGGGGGGVPGSPFPLTFPLPPNASLPVSSQGTGAGAGLGMGIGGAGSGGAGAGAGGGSVRSINTSTSREVGVDQSIRGLDEGLMMLQRALEVKQHLDKARAGVFGNGTGTGTGTGMNGDGNGGDVEMGSGDVDNLQLEYSQILNSLYLLSQSTQFGALPLSLSAQTTTSELTGWCETRAALEFGRKEGVRGGSKTILDVLGGGAQSNSAR